MKSQVFFADLKVTAGKGLLDKLDALLHRTDLKAKIREKDLVAIKLHFGEKGNTTFIRPLFLRRVVEQVKRLSGKTFPDRYQYPLYREPERSHIPSDHGLSTRIRLFGDRCSDSHCRRLAGEQRNQGSNRSSPSSKRSPLPMTSSWQMPSSVSLTSKATNCPE